MFINKNGEHTLTYNTADKVVIGDEAPQLEGSIFPMLSFRNWSLNISMSYKFGGQVYNLTRAAMLKMSIQKRTWINGHLTRGGRM